MLRLHVIGSGSKGNCALVEDVSNGHGVLIDAGLSRKVVFSAAEQIGFDWSLLDAVLITHEHGDHTKGLGVLLRGLYKHNQVPVYALDAVRNASKEITALEDAHDFRSLRLGEDLAFGGLKAVAFRTSHDSAASCGFRIEDQDGDALGYLTDTGIVTDEAHEALFGARILAVESNHDPNLLSSGPYPGYLKRRISSERGHLSNDQAAQALEGLLSDRLEQVVAMHLSAENNLPSLSVRTLGQVLSRYDHPAEVRAAGQFRTETVG